jgi:hypothetical protein
MFNKWIAQLQSVNPEDRFNAVCALARLPAHDDWEIAYHAIEALLIASEPDEHVGSAAAIALSMMSARNMPGGIFYGEYVPDFLPDTYARAQVGLCNQPSPQDFERLDQIMRDLDEDDEQPTS